VQKTRTASIRRAFFDCSKNGTRQIQSEMASKHRDATCDRDSVRPVPHSGHPASQRAAGFAFDLSGSYTLPILASAGADIIAALIATATSKSGLASALSGLANGANRAAHSSSPDAG
jgi:hypothetical protein